MYWDQKKKGLLIYLYWKVDRKFQQRFCLSRIITTSRASWRHFLNEKQIFADIDLHMWHI